MAMRAMATATATAMTWAIVTAMRLVGDKEGKGKSNNGNRNGINGAYYKEGDGGKAMAMATRMAGK